MIRKLLEAFFRHKLLVLLPPVLIPGIVAPVTILTAPKYFEATETVWVEHPLYLTYRDTAVNPWITPVQAEMGRLNELLNTNAFQADIAKRTSLASLADSPTGQSRFRETLTRGLLIGSAGDHVLRVTFQASTPQLAYELDKAVVDAYKDKSATDRADQANVAVTFYQSRLQDAQQRATQASQQLRRYIAAQQATNPDAFLSDPVSGRGQSSALPAAALDPKLADMQAVVQTAQTDVNTTRAALTQAQSDAAAAVQGEDLGFQVLDEARLPTTVSRPPMKKLVIYPVAALVVGLGLSAVVLVLLVAGDRSVRSESDLPSGLRGLGTLPVLNVKRVPKKLRPVATRRAIAAAAGAALPAPSGAK